MTIVIALNGLVSAPIASDADSLKNLLSSSNGNEQVDILISLAKELQRSDPKSAIKYADEAIMLLTKFPDEESKMEASYYKGWAYNYLNESDSAIFYAAETGEIARNNGIEKGLIWESLLKARVQRTDGLYDDAINALTFALENYDFGVDIFLKAKTFNELGSIHRRLGNNEKSFQYHSQALDILTGSGEYEELSTTYTYLGIINNVIGNYDDALKYYHSSLKLNKSLSDTRGIAAATHNIGILYQKTGIYDDALQYFDKAMNYWKALNNKDALASTLNSIGGINELKENNTDALDYYKQALTIWEETGSKYSIAIALNNIGSVYEAMGNYFESLKNLQRAIEIRKSLGDKDGTASSLLVLAELYNKLGKTELAIASAKDGIKLAEEAGSWSTIRYGHNVLATIYEDSGQFNFALEEYKKFKAAEDSIFNTESQRVIAELEAKYKSEEQKQKIELLERESEIQALYRTILISGLAVALIILVLIYNRYRLKKRAHEALQKLHKSEVDAAETKAAMIQMEYEQKKKELEAARDLQLSMLPSKIPDHSKLEIAAHMQTATEVGGDYYDFHRSNDETLTMVIGDATGHGAQAGTIVTATKSLFNLLSREEDIAEILNHINFSIRKMRMPNLFMAMGLVRLIGSELELAGAGMPAALIYRSSEKKVEKIPLKGLPLGSVADFKYSKTSTKLNTGDTVALMSDGLPELFNSNFEMFGYERASTIFGEAIENSPSKIIEHFTLAASKWLNGEKQQDDMTFIVFRVK